MYNVRGIHYRQMLEWRQQFARWLGQEWRRVLLYGSATAVGIMTLCQMLYPAQQVLPGRRIDGVMVGRQTVDQATQQLNNLYKSRTIAIAIGSQHKTLTTAQLGVTINTRPQIESAAHYPWWVRLLPLSLLWYHAPVAPAPHAVRREVAQDYVDGSKATICQVEPRNATIVGSGDSFAIEKESSGYHCELADYYRALGNLQPRLDTAMRVTITPVKETKPARTAKDINALYQQATDRLQAGLTITPESGHAVTVSRAELASWFQFVEEGSQLTLWLNKERAQKYLTETIAPTTRVAAGTTKVYTTDSVETRRDNGSGGYELNIADSLQLLALAIETNRAAAQLTIPRQATQPRVIYERHYSFSSASLLAYIKDTVVDKPNYHIALIELGGQHRSAAANNQQMTSASTYKLYVAYGVFMQVRDGKYTWDKAWQGGRTVKQCLEDMIVKSDNACAESFLSDIGPSNLVQKIKAIGMSGTAFTSSGAVTTASDLANFLAKLEQGDILNPEERGTLLGLMKRQVYRQGIPAGVGVPVADKVGFLEGYLHDAAIVYAPTGTYILVIMTSGSSWGEIAQVSKSIQGFVGR